MTDWFKERAEEIKATYSGIRGDPKFLPTLSEAIEKFGREADARARDCERERCVKVAIKLKGTTQQGCHRTYTGGMQDGGYKRAVAIAAAIERSKGDD